MWPWRKRDRGADSSYRAPDRQVANGLKLCQKGKLADALPLFEQAAAAYRTIGEEQTAPEDRAVAARRVANALRLVGRVRNDLGRYDEATAPGRDAVNLLGQLAPGQDAATIARDHPELAAEFAAAAEDLARSESNLLVVVAKQGLATDERATQALQAAHIALRFRESLVDHDDPTTWPPLASALLQAGHVELLLTQESAVPKITRATGILLAADDAPLKERAMQALQLAERVFSPQLIAAHPVAVDPRRALQQPTP
ncbi:hypothetical protein JQS43_23390 [Natronosporangium hydrolyticum]|uniref:Tetratricopeptide repeat protein n=1 Tax=Natronosporangium hydrolyticum TaxID=2811111 RepID=A0A895YAJ1_9ACTN|nr:hypothetical protein [Natronosporangium hydrolyticum]QSB14401.1 hypothetical protein JQS43_23390 [Natronosporangium hydrolyticum]